MKRYTFEIVLHEGSDEFWESLIEKNKTGCDEIREELEGLIQSTGAWEIGGEFANCELKLTNFTDEE